MTTLQPSDYDLIDKLIEDKLKHYKLIEPIDTTEGEYVRCVEWNGELYTAGKIYHVVNGIIIDNRGFNDDYADLIKHQPFFEPATYAEFLAQEQGKKWKPKVGEWVKSSEINELGVITAFFEYDMCVGVNSQDGHTDMWHYSILTKPTTEEIQSHLVAIAEKKGYKPNVYIRSGKGAFKNLIEDGANFHYTKGMLMHGSILIWCVELGWATILPTETIAPIETEQRWRVEVMLRAGYRDDVKIVVTLNDGFISESSGRQLAEAIKQYLSTNKF